MTAPKPITIRPGKWRMRDGRAATVVRRTEGYGGEYPWEGRIGKYFATWAESGRWNLCGPTEADLIAPWTPKRRAAKRAKAEWGVWVPCKSRDHAIADARHIKANRLSPKIDGKVYEPVVRRAARKGRK